MVTGFIPITPRPAERARRGKGRSMYNTDSYQKYKFALDVLIKQQKIQSGDYVYLEVMFFIPYSASTAKKNKINGKLNRQKPDEDNYRKAIIDSLVRCKIIGSEIGKGKNKKISYDDALLAGGNGLKVWIDDPVGGISFMLLTETEYINLFGNPIDKFFS